MWREITGKKKKDLEVPTQGFVVQGTMRKSIIDPYDETPWTFLESGPPPRARNRF